MTYHYHGIDAEESILIKSLPNLGTWALPNLFFANLMKDTALNLLKSLFVFHDSICTWHFYRHKTSDNSTITQNVQ